MPSFEVVDGPDTGRFFMIRGNSSVIGRDPNADVRLEDGRISRYHVEIRLDGDDGYSLRDMGSSNGTLLNDSPVLDWTKLSHGDHVKLGNTNLLFESNTAELEDDDDSETDDTIVQSLDTCQMPLLAGAGETDDPAALRFLLELTRTADETEKIETLAQVLAEGLTTAVKADRVMLFIGRDQTMKPVLWDMPRHMQTMYRQPVSFSVVSQVVRERVAVMSRLGEDDRFRGAASVATGRITSAICVPLGSDDELLGALYLDRLGGAPAFSASDLELATAAGLQCKMALQNIRRLEELRASRDRLEVELSGPSGFIGDASSLKPVYDFLNKAAPTDAGVLILGESGTGKELIARAIHKQSPRVDRPFVIVNCAALAENLAEAELFGHERGAFTGADKSRPGRFLAADGGTIFLDEIGELPEPIQAKLLRVLESGEITPVGEAGVRTINVRVIAATNRDLAKEVDAGRFRRDLYYRLNILAVKLPPLRERAEDAVHLLEHFVSFFSQRCGRPAPKITDAVRRHFLAYTWPGNVRELRNAVERMVILAQADTLSEKDLPLEIAGKTSDGLAGIGGLRPLEDVTRDHILAVLDGVSGNKKRAAEILQIDRSTLYAKLKSYGVDEG